jgi:GTP-binding protein
VEPFPADGSDPVANYRTIRQELERYNPVLAAKPEFVALSKSELTGSDDVLQRIERELGRPLLAVSAVTGQGLADLIRSVAQLLAEEVRSSQLATPAIASD